MHFSGTGSTKPPLRIFTRRLKNGKQTAEPLVEEQMEGLPLPFSIESSEQIRKEFGKEIAHAFEVNALHPDYSATQVAAEIDKTVRRLEKYTAKLKHARILIRIGSKLGDYWEIKEPKCNSPK